jgi:hypothetical protein
MMSNWVQRTNVNEVLGLLNHLDICHPLSACVSVQSVLLTGVLNAVFRWYAKAPCAYTPNDLCMACPIRRP